MTMTTTRTMVIEYAKEVILVGLMAYLYVYSNLILFRCIPIQPIGGSADARLRWPNRVILFLFSFFWTFIINSKIVSDLEKLETLLYAILVG